MVVDSSVSQESTFRKKAEDGNDAQVGAPMKGEVVEIKVAKDDIVEKGQGTLCNYLGIYGLNVIHIVHLLTSQ